MPAAVTVSPVWPLMAMMVPAEGAMIWVSASLTLSEASWAWSLASCAPAAAILAWVLAVSASLTRPGWLCRRRWRRGPR